MPLTNSHKIISAIVSSLFTAEERRLGGVKEQLISFNKECFPNKPHDGFSYEGSVYVPHNLVRGKPIIVSLHLSLTDAMDEYLSDIQRVWTDRHSISQMLFTLLSQCDSAQDIRDALPDCVVDTLPDLKRLARDKEEAYTLATNARNYRQYLKVLPRIEFYAMTRLLY